MRTIYIYLSWTGWIWFVISMTYLMVKLKKKRNRPQTLLSDRTEGDV